MPAMESNNMELDDLLKPDQFDWADDVEECFSDDTASDDSMSDGDVEETMASFYELERQPSSHGHDRAADMEDDNSETELSVAEDSVAAPVGPLLVNGTASGPADSDDSSGSEVDEEFESMLGDVNREFSFRRAYMASDNDGEIHHFNWLGCPVFGYSATPAAISLLFLLSEPKVPAIGDEWRQESIMRRAMVFVDPVIVYLDDSGWSSLCLKGYDLVQWATGKAFKFYSPHGHWAQDGRESADDSAIDDGDLGNYIAENVAAGNGFIDLFSIRSRVQWQSSRDESFYRTYKERSTAARRRMRHREFNPSPLGQSMVPDDFEDEIEEIETECNAIEVERPASRLSRKRSFYRGLGELGSFTGHSSIDDNESDSDTSSEDSDEDERRSAIDYFIQLSDSEREEAERRKTRMVVKKSFKPGLSTIVEEDENSHEDQNGHRGQQHRISSGIHSLNGPLGSETVLHDSNERSGEETNLQAVFSASQTHGASRDRKNKWKKNLRRISNKARNTLRFKVARLSLVSKLSGSVESSPSSAPESENGTDTPSRRNAIIENIFEPLNYGFSEQYVSFPTPRFDSIREDEEPPKTSSKKFVTKLKNAFHRFPSEHATTAAPKKKRNSFSDGFKEVWISGFWAMGTYPMVMV